MSYSTPPAFVSGDTLLASELNVLSDDISYLYGVSVATSLSAVQVTRSATQSVATSNAEYVSFDTENLDYGGWWSSGTTVTVPAGAIPSGYTTIAVLVFAQVTWATNGTGKRRIQVHKNGSSFGGWKISAVDDDTTALYLSELTTVAAGDTIKLDVWQNSGGSLNVTEARLTVARFAAAS